MALHSVFVGLAVLASAVTVMAGDEALGLFEGHADVGAVGKPGSVVYDAKAGAYTVSGGGENMWFGTDAFHFVWKEASGDLALAADVQLVGTGSRTRPRTDSGWPSSPTRRT